MSRALLAHAGVDGGDDLGAELAAQALAAGRWQQIVEDVERPGVLAFGAQQAGLLEAAATRLLAQVGPGFRLRSDRREAPAAEREQLSVDREEVLREARRHAWVQKGQPLEHLSVRGARDQQLAAAARQVDLAVPQEAAAVTRAVTLAGDGARPDFLPGAQ